MSWIAVAIGGSAVVGAGAGMYSANKAGKASGGYGVVEMPQYSFNEPRMRLASDYISDGLNRLSEGKAPAYYDNALPNLRAGMSRNLDNEYFGRTGERGGVLANVANVGAMTGLGKKKVMAQTNRALRDYADKETAIDEYLTKLGVSINQQSEATYLNASNQMSMGPNAQAMSYNSPGGGAVDMSGMGSALSYLTKPQGYGGGGAGNYSSMPTSMPGYDSSWGGMMPSSSGTPSWYNSSGGFGGI